MQEQINAIAIVSHSKNTLSDEEILNILKQNTYFDNCRDMCNTLGFEYDSKKLDDIIEFAYKKSRIK